MGSRNEALRTVILFPTTTISDTRIKISHLQKNKSLNFFNQRRSCGEELGGFSHHSYAVLSIFIVISTRVDTHRLNIF